MAYNTYASAHVRTDGVADSVVIKGVIRMQEEANGPKKPLSGVQIYMNGQLKDEKSNYEGAYTLVIPANTKVKILFYYYFTYKEVVVGPYSKGTTQRLDLDMPLTSIEIDPASVSGRRRRLPPDIIDIKPKIARSIPGPSGSSIEALIKTMPGVASGNEMSSQYNVRGGSFDENLVYVNDFEITRPQLVRTGQQEGLSFINPFMVSKVHFSAGGFQAKYGDKMSSVLDVSYATVDSLKVFAEASMMGAELGVGGRSNNNRLSFISGLRYRNNNYVLGTLDVQGQYNPSFLDFQSLLIYHMSREWRLEWLSNVAVNRFQLTPVSQETSFGTIQTALKLFVGMAGNEIMEYQSAMNGLSLVYEPSKYLNLKLMASTTSTLETEKYDVEGAYRLDLIDNNLGSDDFGNSVATLGFGYFIQHARNELFYRVSQVEHRGRYTPYGKSIDIQWGVGYRNDIIEDVFKEWNYVDSAGYNITTFGTTDEEIRVANYINSRVNLVNHRFQPFVQAEWELQKEKAMMLRAGMRSHYTSLNQQQVYSPRIQFSFQPNLKHNKRAFKDTTLNVKKDLEWRISAGYYYQPPFYREMRDFNGQINTDVKAQRALHVIAGNDYRFTMGGRPFKLMTEAYYKDLDNLVPYVLDNMRIRYYANNHSRGYATGFDARINGEFVKDLESWFTLSMLKTSEQILYINDMGEEVLSPFLRRPTDRRVSMSMMIQDRMPGFPNFRGNLNLIYGAPMPYFLPGPFRYKDAFRIPPYRRVDAGFLYMLVNEGDKSSRMSRYFSEAWIGLEVFNMLGINNVISYLWVRDLSGTMYGVPNFLTNTRVNIKFFATIGS
jgi:hypothetical protein